MNTKVALGQYYTKQSPFSHPRFRHWLSNLPSVSTARFIEPFAGANNIVSMILTEFPEISASQWEAFDIHPEAQQVNMVNDLKLTKRDTILDYPKGFDVCITNPPYLAKNSATRKGLEVEFGAYQDLFEVSLSKMLTNTPYVAAIIPESFISRRIFTERLEFVISLNMEMFDDTEFPVCLAVFSPTRGPGFEIWRDDICIARMPDLDSAVHELLPVKRVPGLKFNDPHGPLGLTAIDDTKSAAIRFRSGDEIASNEIKATSRALTRISIPWLKANPSSLEELIKAANSKLDTYRTLTNDVYLTSFKGLRSDGMYRRRLSWDLAQAILATTMFEKFDAIDNEVLF